jgi:hypothetical protein
LSPELAAASSGIHLVDYGQHRGRSVLLGSGCGLMMAVMDAVPEFRWCADLDRGGHAIDFAILVARDVRTIGLVGWFSISSPAAFRQVLSEPLPCRVIAYGGNIDLGCETLREFLQLASSI